MDNKKAQEEIIDLLKENELAMRKLYSVYAEKIGGFSSFWKEIAEEESSHAAWIETLRNKMGTALADFSEKRFSAEAIRKNIEFLEEKKKEAENSEIGLAQALENAVHIERGLLENKFFEVFKGDSKELKAILEALRLGTEEHLRRMEELWGREK